MATRLNGWFKVWADAPDHVKMKRLARRLGHEYAGFWWVFRLWAVTAKYAPADGVLEGVLARDELEDVIGWTGEPGELIRALLAVRLLDEAPLRTHEWHEHQPKILEAEKLGERATARGEENAPRRERDENAEKSAYFLHWWAMVPLGKRHGIGPAYQAWCRHGLDDPGAKGDAARAELYRNFAAQLGHDHWRGNFLNAGKNAALTYIRKQDWQHWSVKPPADAKPTPGVRTNTAAVERRRAEDEANLRRDWMAVDGNATREFPGYEEAMREMIEHSKGRN